MNAHKCPARATWIAAAPLGFCKNAIFQARFVGRARQVTCPNHALHEFQQVGNIESVLQQVGNIGRSVDTQDKRANIKRVIAAEVYLRSRTHIVPGRMDMTRSTPEQDEENLSREWRGALPPPCVPCGIYDRPRENDERFYFSGWLVHRRCPVESAEETVSRVDDRFGVAMRGRT